MTDTDVARGRPAAIVFADVEHYSGLADDTTLESGDDRLERFVSWLGPLAEHIRSNAPPGGVIKSAGDGFMLVYPEESSGLFLTRALEHALAIRQHFMRSRNHHGLWLRVRVALHFGDVRVVTDPFTLRPDVVGGNVITGARLEPRTLPDMVFATQEFRDHVTEHTLPTGCQFARVGKIELAKRWRSREVYQVTCNGVDAVHVRQYPTLNEDAYVGVHVQFPARKLKHVHLAFGASHLVLPQCSTLGDNGLDDGREPIIVHKLFLRSAPIPLLRVFTDPPAPVRFIPEDDDGIPVALKNHLESHPEHLVIEDRNLKWYQIPDMNG